LIDNKGKILLGIREVERLKEQGKLDYDFVKREVPTGMAVIYLNIGNDAGAEISEKIIKYVRRELNLQFRLTDVLCFSKYTAAFILPSKPVWNEQIPGKSYTRIERKISLFNTALRNAVAKQYDKNPTLLMRYEYETGFDDKAFRNLSEKVVMHALAYVRTIKRVRELKGL
jgi:hypothetical protein